MEFKFPDVGEGIHEGKIVSWKVKEGDHVTADQVLAEVETDKAVVEVPSPQEGTIGKLHANEGDVIKVGAVMVTFGEGGAASEAPAEEKERAPEQGTKKVESNLTPTAPTPEEHAPPAKPVEEAKDVQGPSTDQPDRVLATPATRRFAREKGIDIHTLHGTGEHGRVTKDDILAATGGAPVQSPAPQTPEPQQTTPNQPAPAPQPTQQPAAPQPTQAPPTPVGQGNVTPYSGRRKAIGDHLVQAHNVPTVTKFAEVDVTRMVDERNKLKDKAAERGVKLTFLPFFCMAAVSALKKYPKLNSSLTSEGIHTYDRVHLGIAVDTEKGLVVPVVKEADSKSLVDYAREIAELAGQAKENKLQMEQMKGGTFTISSVGPFRVQGYTPILNYPEGGILGIGAIQEKPWVVEGEVHVRKIVTLSLTYDHRIVDGVEAAKFFTEIVNMLEDPELLILEGI